jgi:hypothetical protein
MRLSRVRTVSRQRSVNAAVKDPIAVVCEEQQAIMHAEKIQMNFTVTTVGTHAKLVHSVVARAAKMVGGEYLGGNNSHGYLGRKWVAARGLRALRRVALAPVAIRGGGVSIWSGCGCGSAAGARVRVGGYAASRELCPGACGHHGLGAG